MNDAINTLPSAHDPVNDARWVVQKRAGSNGLSAARASRR
jgi:hypothetical protein